MGFAIRAGLAPPGATAETHGEIRNMVKPISLGSQYGMSKYGAAAQSGKSLAWAATTLAAYRHAYPVFIQWQQNVAAQALFDERIASVLGWPMAVHAETKQRTLLNYPAQANGAECMRVAAIAAYEAGIQDRRAGARCVLDHGPAIRARRHDRHHEGDHGHRRPGRSRYRHSGRCVAQGALAALPRRCPQAEGQRPGDVGRNSSAARQRRITQP